MNLQTVYAGDMSSVTVNRLLPISAPGLPITTPPVGIPMPYIGPVPAKPVGPPAPYIGPVPARPVGPPAPFIPTGNVMQLSPSPSTPLAAPQPQQTYGASTATYANPVPGSLATSLTGAATAPQLAGILPGTGGGFPSWLLPVAGVILLILLLR